MAVSYKVAYHGITLSFSTCRGSGPDIFFPVNGWGYDPSDNDAAHVQLAPAIHEEIKFHIDLSDFKWHDAEWLAFVAAESSEKTPLVLLISKNLMGKSGNKTATSVLWRYPDGKAISDRMSLTFKQLPVYCPPPPPDWDRLHWRCFAQLRIKLIRLKTCTVMDPDAKSANQLFGPLRLRSQVPTCFPGRERANGVKDLLLERHTVKPNSEQHKIRGFRFKYCWDEGDNFVVHYRSAAWQAYAKTHKVEEDDLGAPARFYRPPRCDDEGDSPPEITDLDAPTNGHPRPAMAAPAARPARARGASATQAAQGQPAAAAAPPATGSGVQRTGTAGSSGSAVADASPGAAPTPQPGPSSLANGQPTGRPGHSSPRVPTEAPQQAPGSPSDYLLRHLPAYRSAAPAMRPPEPGPSDEAPQQPEPGPSEASHQQASPSPAASAQAGASNAEAFSSAAADAPPASTAAGSKRDYDAAFVMEELSGLSARTSRLQVHLRDCEGFSPERRLELQERVRRVGRTIDREIEDIATDEVDAVARDLEAVRIKRRCRGL